MSRRTAAALAVPLTLLFALSGCALLGGGPKRNPRMAPRR